jgi:hypothetical protein
MQVGRKPPPKRMELTCTPESVRKQLRE